MTACLHCGLTVPRRSPHPQFCCRGCEQVFELLRQSNLGRFYDLGGGDGHPVGSVRVARTRDWLRVHERRADAGLAHVEADVQSIHCAACVWLLQELWRRMAGTVDLQINPSLGRMRIVYDPAQLDVERYFDQCESLGYAIGPPGKTESGDDRQLLIRFGVCVALALNAMLFAFAVYAGMSAADGALFDLFGWLSAAIATLAVAVGGPVFFRASLAGLRTRALHLDLPIALGIALAYGASLFAFVTGTGVAYFDSVTVFVALMLGGRFVQRRAVRQNRNYLLENDGTEHVRIRRLRGNAIELAPVRDIVPGDRLLLVPGDLVPMRVRLTDEAGAFSLDWINGESQPRRFERGQTIPAGAFVAGQTGSAVEALATARESGLDRLLAQPVADDPESAGGFWSGLNRAYVAIVLVLAGAAALVWSVIDPSRIVDVVTSVLIVTCPCALGIATPLAVELVLARLRRKGVFVRHSSLLDRARDVVRVVFDKTGTLTWGGVRANELRVVPDDFVDVLYTMASSSNHPVSRAVADAVGKAAGPHQHVLLRPFPDPANRRELSGHPGCRLPDPGFETTPPAAGQPRRVDHVLGLAARELPPGEVRVVEACHLGRRGVAAQTVAGARLAEFGQHATQAVGEGEVHLLADHRPDQALEHRRRLRQPQAALAAQQPRPAALTAGQAFERVRLGGETEPAPELVVEDSHGGGRRSPAAHPDGHPRAPLLDLENRQAPPMAQRPQRGRAPHPFRGVLAVTTQVAPGRGDVEVGGQAQGEPAAGQHPAVAARRHPRRRQEALLKRRPARETDRRADRRHPPAGGAQQLAGASVARLLQERRRGGLKVSSGQAFELTAAEPRGRSQGRTVDELRRCPAQPRHPARNESALRISNDFRGPGHGSC